MCDPTIEKFGIVEVFLNENKYLTLTFLQTIVMNYCQKNAEIARLNILRDLITTQRNFINWFHTYDISVSTKSSFA